MTALAQAFEDAGFQSAEAILREIAREALLRYPLDRAARHSTLSNAVRDRPELLWRYFELFREAAADRWIAEVRPGVAAERQDTSASRPSSSAESIRQRTAALANAGDAARASVMRNSILDRFTINGHPLGDVTPTEAREFIAAKARQSQRDVRFIDLLTAGMNFDRPIRAITTPDLAEEAWRRANAEVAA